ncbi:MAG: S41 family peptidase, partial [Litorimonas sp.]
LYDPHIVLSTNNQKSPRLIPSSSDLWFQLIDQKYIVTAVRPLSGAADKLRVGDELISFNKMTPDDLALTRIHSCRNTVSQNRKIWAINAAIAGRRTDSRIIKVMRDDAILSFNLGVPEVSLPNDPITSKSISGQIGYIKFNNSLGNSETVNAFNAALETLRDTGGLILDLRETAGGGGTEVAEPILGRFVDEKFAYQRTVLRNGSADDREIEPSGSWTYKKPVVVLVGRWTGSMGEGMAIGFDGMARGVVKGSRMAGLAGGTEPIKLKETGVSLWLPTYDLHHIDGTPRHSWSPSKITTADNGSQDDTLLKNAIIALQNE